MKVSDLIAKLQKLDPDLLVYIDCSHCGTSLSVGELKEVVLRGA